MRPFSNPTHHRKCLLLATASLTWASCATEHQPPPLQPSPAHPLPIEAPHKAPPHPSAPPPSTTPSTTPPTTPPTPSKPVTPSRSGPSVSASACDSHDDCVVTSLVEHSCCPTPCGATNALHRDAVHDVKAWMQAHCDDSHCPSVACMYNPADYATCDAGHCVAHKMSDRVVVTAPAPAATPDCAWAFTSTLPQVKLSAAQPTCTWRLAQALRGVHEHILVNVRDPIAALTLQPPDTARCLPTPQDRLLFDGRLLSGHRAMYAPTADVGNCPPTPPTPTQLPAGSQSVRFTWLPRHYLGPSDIGASPGEPLSPGHYTLRLEARGTIDGRDWLLRAEHPVEITP